MATVEKNKVLNQIIKDFQSSDVEVVMKALKKVRDKGKTTILEPLFDLFEETQEATVKAEIKSILADIKDSYALEVIVDKLKSGSEGLNEVLLFALWNSNLNAVDYIPEIVEAAKSGNYMIALEALTVIENLDGPFSNEKLTEAQFILNEYFSENLDEKEALMRSILDVVLKLEDTAY
ncbi:MAG: hypothetical protein N4A35_15620 [Flavobacteriales bacterium]|nr:hypothetical protein [Flavobacteriales bacterium]